jgi:hypothetical protein
MQSWAALVGNGIFYLFCGTRLIYFQLFALGVAMTLGLPFALARILRKRKDDHAP